MKAILERIAQVGVAPVISLPGPEHAEPLAAALMRGGLPLAEVTFRTEAAAEGIARMKHAQPDLLAGAGTVLSVDQARTALDAGASFIVAPGFDPVVVDFCLDQGVPVLPGVATASELTQAVLRGLPAVKFFPAEALGGLAMLKALAGPFSGVRFMPTGGVSRANMGAYLAWDRILAVGGTWIAPKQQLLEQAYGRIEALAREAVLAASEARGVMFA